MPEFDLNELATLARSHGYDRDRCITRLIERIERDWSYMQYRKRKGRQTAHDYALAEDVAVTALVVLLLQGTQVQP